jgi:membrane protein implicated in regulation of membrane protease activity
MVILLLIRRLGPRGRKITGVVLLALAAAVAAVSAALSAGLYTHAVILAVLGAVVLWAPVKGRDRRAPKTARRQAQS